MVVASSRESSVEAFARKLEEVAGAPSVRFLLILACDGNGYRAVEMDPVLQRQPMPLIGGIFPKIVVGGECFESGFVILGMEVSAQIHTVGGLEDSETDFEAKLEGLEVDLAATKTIIVMVDGLAARINALVENLFSVFGLEANYIGGGAGSLSFKQEPCLFTGDGLMQDCAVIAFAELETGIGVSHGWSSFDGPFEVTKSEDNAIVSLDWRPAYEVYKEAVEAHAGDVFSGRDFFEVSKSFPFGISKIGAEKVVRDPVALREDGAIVCIGDVPTQAFVYILSGDPSSLVAAAGEALRLGIETYEGSEEKSAVLLIDCISRYLFLGDGFGEELASAGSAGSAGVGRPLYGALTLGEIANNRKDYLEFYNKTAVVGVFET